MTKIALIDKAPNKTRYSDYFDFEFDHYHMSSVPITKLLKKDVDLEVDLTPYDFVILVGAEAAKEYAKITVFIIHPYTSGVCYKSIVCNWVTSHITAKHIVIGIAIRSRSKYFRNIITL